MRYPQGCGGSFAEQVSNLLSHVLIHLVTVPFQFVDAVVFSYKELKL